MTPWLLKHSPGFSSILIYTGPAGVAKAHVHWALDHFFWACFLKNFSHEGVKERGRTGKESQPEVTATSRIPSQESAGKIFSRGAVCVFLILFTKLTSSSSSSSQLVLCMCAYARVSVAQIADLSEVLFVLQVCPHYKHFPDQSC